MGHLFSRAFKRLTQCSSNSGGGGSSSQARNQSSNEQQQRDGGDNQAVRTTVESIPVGQSIDSSDYAAFETATGRSQTTEDKENTRQSNGVEGTASGTNTAISDQNKPQVEEAVIKIQALVRGHLTRKALKDAQTHNATLPLNALGQSQFDEESLTRNPPNAVFLPSFPMNVNFGSTTNNDNNNNHANNQQNQANKLNATKAPLESIAEETQNSINQNVSAISSATTTTTLTTPTILATDSQQTNLADTSRRRLSPKGALSPLQLSTGESRDSLSPVPSEANASIDLACETPTSASIDIGDHNIRPADGIASILHPHQTLSSAPTADSAVEQNIVSAPPSAVPEGATTRVADASPTSPVVPVINSSDSLDSAAESAAAIRIQSAFRGYKTRKHSPYRRRSPNSTSAPPISSLSSETAAMVAEGTPTATTTTNGTFQINKRNALRQQDALAGYEDWDADDEIDIIGDALAAIDTEESNQLEQDVQSAGRRPSRQRQRDSSPTAASNVDEGGDRIARGHEEDGGDLTTTNSTPPTSTITTAAKEATSIDELTATEESTVREAVQTQHHRLKQPPGARAEITNSSALETSGGGGPSTGALVDDDDEDDNERLEQSVSLDQLTASILRETGLSTETAEEAGSVSVGRGNLLTNEEEAQPASSAQNQRSSLGAKSDGAISFELDTDSSILGAALSLNEEASEAAIAQSRQATAQPVIEAADATAAAASRGYDNKSQDLTSISESVASEARHLIDELNRAAENENVEGDNDRLRKEDQEQEATLNRMTDYLESALEQATEQRHGDDESNGKLAILTDDKALVTSSLDEEEQRTIELESDEIERRDPRGHVAEERAKSPQIKTEQPSLVASSSDRPAGADSPPPSVSGSSVAASKNQQRLTVESPEVDEAIASGRSSPALNSSNGPTSSDEDSDRERVAGANGLGSKTAGGNQQAQKPGQSKNNKKRNRNKRKGKK